jgi:hypothetical protein
MNKFLIASLLFTLYSTVNNVFSQDDIEIKNTLNNWLVSWSNKNVNEYKKYLTDDYEYYGTDGVMLNRDQRLTKIKKTFKDYSYISVTHSDLQIIKDGTENDVKLIFKMYYNSDKYNDRSLKTLRMYKGKETENHWKIYKEFTDYLPVEQEKPIQKSVFISESKYGLVKTSILILFAGVILFMIFTFVRINFIIES